MPAHPFLRDEAKTRLQQAVAEVESRSAAEIVVAVRPASGRYGAPGMVLGALLAWAGLGYMLFSDQVFGLWAIQGYVGLLLLLGGALGGGALALWPTLLGARRTHEHVTQAAQATFYRLGVSKTRDRSGILVYISLRERRCEVVPDLGVQRAITEEEWRAAVTPLQAVVAARSHRPDGVEGLAKAIAGIAPLVARALPRRADDENELPDLAGPELEVAR